VLYFGLSIGGALFLTLHPIEEGTLALAVLRILKSGNRYEMLFAKHLPLNTLDEIESNIL